MLEKVRTKTQTSVTDPLKNAKLWGIPIWTVNKVFCWLEKVSANISLSKSAPKEKPNSSVRELSLSAPYIKFEPLTRDARPVYKSLDSWPVLDVEGRPGSCPFKMKPKPENDNESIMDPKMSRRNKPRISVRNSKDTDEKPHSQEKILNGYCEICHLEYRELQEHLESEMHQQFIKNDSNYLTLDTLIGQTTNVDHFLRLNGTICKDGLRRSLRVGRSPNGKYNGLDDDRPMTRGRTNYNKRFSNLSALSPTGSDSGHQLRSKTTLHSPVNNHILPLEDENFSPKSQKSYDRKNSRSSEDLHENCIKQSYDKSENKFPEHGKSKKTCLKTKRISADERLVNDNKTYYKVEVMTTKLRSSGLGSHYDHSTAKNQSPIPEEPENHQEPSSLVVKFKKIRRSELETLNDEAENFMFPRKEDSCFEDMGTDDGPNTTCSPQREHTLEIPSSEFEKTPRNKEDFEHNEEYLEKIYLKNIRSLIKEKKAESEETPGKRKTRKIIDYHEENSETDSLIRTRPKKPVNYLEPRIVDENSDSNSLIRTRPKNKNISYLEESSIDEEILANTPTTRKNNIVNNSFVDKTPNEESKNSENHSNMILRVPRKKFIIKTFKVKRPLKQKYKKSETIVQNTKLKIVKKKFKTIVKPLNIKPLNHKKQKFTKRKLLSRKNSATIKKEEIIPDNLDETAQDGTELIEIKRCSSGRKRKIDTQPSLDDLDVSKDATSRDSVSLCDSEGRRRGRRKQAELFIEENQKYFKFESPVSRLRYQGSIFGAIKSPPRLNGEQEEPVVSNKERPEFHLDEVKYFFEIEPKSEPWYETFTRQDRGEERYTSLSDPGYQTRLILPYQIPAPFYPLDPQICISQYDRIKKYIIDPESEETKEDESISITEQSEESQGASEITEEVTKEKSSHTNNQETKTTEKIPTNTSNKLKFNRRRRKRFNMKVQNHSRKSPRQHASTLAILSSLINQRKKRERKSAGESDLSRSSLGPILEESPEKVQEQPVEDVLSIKNEDIENVYLEKDEKIFPEEVHKEIEAFKCISEILSTSIELDVSDELEGIVLKDTPDAIDLIENYNEYDCQELPMLDLTERRSIRRKCKKKRNTTGWPSPKKRLFPRKVTKNGEITLEEQTGLSEASVEVNDSEKCSEYSNSDLENRINLNLDSVDTNCNLNSSESIKQGLSKLSNAENTDLIKNVLQPLDKIKKNNCELNSKTVKSRLRSSSSPDHKPNAKKAKIQVSPRSPRKLRAPKEKWYRER